MILGSGLGKEEQGSAAPIKASMKFDTRGLGHDLAKDVTGNDWWDHVYNDAANSVAVNKNENGVAVSSRPKKKRKKKESSIYKNFVKNSVLSDGIETKELNVEAENEEQQPQIRCLSDEDLLKACGGRTAHKAARHGHKMNGKLARIQKQELEAYSKRRKLS